MTASLFAVGQGNSFRYGSRYQAESDRARRGGCG